MRPADDASGANSRTWCSYLGEGHGPKVFNPATGLRGGAEQGIAVLGRTVEAADDALLQTKY